jgi:hypothetical protein
VVFRIMFRHLSVCIFVLALALFDVAVVAQRNSDTIPQGGGHARRARLMHKRGGMGFNLHARQDVCVAPTDLPCASTDLLK